MAHVAPDEWCRHLPAVTRLGAGRGMRIVNAWLLYLTGMRTGGAALHIRELAEEAAAADHPSGVRAGQAAQLAV
jgi:hypothetical protein